MSTSKHNPQPFRLLLKARGLTVAQVAELCGVPFLHMRECAMGRVRPNDLVRERLPLILSVPLADLFTSDRLERPHRPRRSPGTKFDKLRAECAEFDQRLS